VQVDRLKCWKIILAKERWGLIMYFYRHFPKSVLVKDIYIKIITEPLGNSNSDNFSHQSNHNYLLIITHFYQNS
jgi:hypothetical protein